MEGKRHLSIGDIGMSPNSETLSTANSRFELYLTAIHILHVTWTSFGGYSAILFTMGVPPLGGSYFYCCISLHCMSSSVLQFNTLLKGCNFFVVILALLLLTLENYNLDSSPISYLYPANPL